MFSLLIPNIVFTGLLKILSSKPLFIKLKNGFILFVFIAFMSLDASAQKGVSELNIGFKVHDGIIWAHTPKNEILVKGHFPLYEASLFMKTGGSKQWQQLYRKPQIGFSVFYSNLANKEAFGFCTGVIPWVNFNLLDNTKWFRLFFKAGIGVGYLDKTFNLEDNYKNLAISSKINVAINFQLENQIQLSPNLFGSASLTLYHFSNGKIQMPNTGINAPTMNLGLNYRISKKESPNIVPLDEFKKNKHIVTTFSGGWKNPDILGTINYPVINSSTTFENQFNRKNAYTLGLDLIYDRARVIDQRESPDENFRLVNSGITIGHLLIVGKLNVVTQWGVYMSSKALAKKSYQRIGLRYYIKEKFALCFALNTHFGNADHIEWGIGYRF